MRGILYQKTETETGTPLSGIFYSNTSILLYLLVIKSTIFNNESSRAVPILALLHMLDKASEHLQRCFRLIAGHRVARVFEDDMSQLPHILYVARQPSINHKGLKE